LHEGGQLRSWSCISRSLSYAEVHTHSTINEQNLDSQLMKL
jgi:hypothetical protein